MGSVATIRKGINGLMLCWYGKWAAHHPAGLLLKGVRNHKQGVKLASTMRLTVRRYSPKLSLRQIESILSR